MHTLILSAKSSSALDEAVRVLKSGGLVAFPTDTVYGLGAIAFDDKAVNTIYVAKDRPLEKSIPILLADGSDLELVASDITQIARRLADRFWPGALTLVVQRKPSLPESVSSTDTVGTRVPDHPITRSLLRAAGPLAVTSANRSGGPDPSSAEEVLTQLGGRIPLILDGGRTPGGRPSTVVDCTQNEPIILRDGPLSLERIRQALK